MTAQSPYRTADPLGAVVSEHSVARVQQSIRVVLGLFCLVVAIDCVWLGIWTRFGDVNVTGAIVSGVIALVFFWLSWDAFSQYAQARRQRVTCHEHGVRIRDKHRDHDVRFDDVTSVGGMLWEPTGEKAPAGTVLWIDDAEGARTVLPSPLSNPHEFGEYVRRMTFDKRRLAAQARIANGDETRFGACALGALVLTVNGEVFSRGEIEKVNLSSRWLAIKPRSHAQRMVPTEQIPDLDVMLALLET
ncbi:MAG: hypothetical protein IPM54_04785 [Polyangiaceae bacterium]|nr:hypothetical protein [Polyangiaceae bacterium]